MKIYLQLFTTKRQNELYSRFCKLIFVSSPSLPWQHGTRQQGWHTGGTLRKQSPNLTVQFILSLSIEEQRHEQEGRGRAREGGRLFLA